MIPISLVLSRSRTFANFPLLPLIFAWPSSPPVPTAALRIGTTGWSLFGARGDADLPYGPIFGWPPSPMMASILFPLVGRLYREQHAKVMRAILGKEEPKRGPVRDIIWDFGGGDPMPFRARIGLAVDPVQPQPPQDPQAQEQQAEQEAGPEGEGDVQAEPDAEGQEQQGEGLAERTIRITNASLGRAIGGALALPTIANCMGAFLKQLARLSPTLRTFLAIRPPLTGQRRVSLLGPWLESQGFAQMHWLRKVGISLQVALNLVGGGTRVWYEADPVWWRNSVGLGLFLVVSALWCIGCAALLTSFSAGEGLRPAAPPLPREARIRDTARQEPALRQRPPQPARPHPPRAHRHPPCVLHRRAQREASRHAHPQPRAPAHPRAIRHHIRHRV